VVCDSPNACQSGDGTCDAASGDCVYTSKDNGTACGDDDFCWDGACCDGCVQDDGTCGGCLVFITSGFYGIAHLNSDFGEADSTCQDLALEAGLPGTYLAWLSSKLGGDHGNSPATRFRRSARPYKRWDGVVVANDWDDLTSGTLRNPILLTETGGQNVTYGERVWTATGTDGTYYTAFGEHDCNSWTAENLPFAYTGSAKATDATWTQPSGDAFWGCDRNGALFCFQQQ
jgi:hypothetical protein